MNTSLPGPTTWRNGTRTWVTYVISAALFAVLFYQGRTFLLHMWLDKEEYSHAILIPFISLFLIWQRKDRLELLPFQGSWLGAAIVIFGSALFLIGQLSVLAMLRNYAMVMVIYGLALSHLGWSAFRLIQVPILILAFMVPLPGFLYETLSAKLQLLSSEIGVAFIRLFGISVHLEGNVIDLGSMKLQVAEACSGLRYLFPLTTLGFIAAYFYKVEMWKRVVVFLSSIPITILMNSFRIGAIGILVEYWGRGQAEGFLHDFEGWAVFMACTGTLIAEMWLLTMIGSEKRPLREVFGITFPDATPPHAHIKKRTVVIPFVVSTMVLAAVAITSLTVADRSHIPPHRREMNDFPLSIETWKGIKGSLDQTSLDILMLDDYIAADYSRPSGDRVNLFISYYATQEGDKVPHSPRACLPGGGWQVSGISTVSLQDVRLASGPLKVNRAILRHGDDTQVVYYWFQQRGRNITSEYLTKWYLFWDAIMRQRSDGSLVRLMAPVAPREDIAMADQRLTEFARAVVPLLPEYVPN